MLEKRTGRETGFDPLHPLGKLPSLSTGAPAEGTFCFSLQLHSQPTHS